MGNIYGYGYSNRVGIMMFLIISDLMGNIFHASICSFKGYSLSSYSGRLGIYLSGNKSDIVSALVELVLIGEGNQHRKTKIFTNCPNGWEGTTE